MEQAVSPVLEVSQPAPSTAIEWSLTKRIVFRFVCIYWLLYSLPATGRTSFLGIIPGLGTMNRALWHAIVPWIAIHVVHLSGQVTQYRPTGSGDTTLDYVHTACLLALAAVIELVWSLLDRKRRDYRTLHLWLRLLVRYTLATTLFSYGFSKVFPLQFPYPALGRLIQPYGDFSPMGVLWSFMGSSPAYTIFAGTMEVLGGLLLLFPRTALLGGMASAALMLNVVVLNFCYDVPVKLYSTHLFLMAVFLIAPDLGKLAAFLAMNRAVDPPTASSPVFGRRWIRISALALKVVLIGFFLVENIVAGYRNYQNVVAHPARPPLYGLYQVESFMRNGKEIPPLTADQTRWKTVVAQYPNFILVRLMDDSLRGLGAQYNAANSTLTLSGPSRMTLVYSRPDAEHVVLTGTMEGDPVNIRMRRRELSEFLLVNRGFHWINEVPFNR